VARAGSDRRETSLALQAGAFRCNPLQKGARVTLERRDRRNLHHVGVRYFVGPVALRGGRCAVPWETSRGHLHSRTPRTMAPIGSALWFRGKEIGVAETVGAQPDGRTPVQVFAVLAPNTRASLRHSAPVPARVSYFVLATRGRTWRRPGN